MRCICICAPLKPLFAGGPFSPIWGAAFLRHRGPLSADAHRLEKKRALHGMFYAIGRDISEKMKVEGWGSKVIEQLSQNLQNAFPGTQRYGSRNLRYIRSFAEAYPDESILQQVVAKTSWGHNIAILDQISDYETRLWYAQQAIEHGWSRSILVHQIESNLYSREARTITNFKKALPAL